MSERGDRTVHAKGLLCEALLRWNIDQELGSLSALDSWIEEFLSEPKVTDRWRWLEEKQT